MAIGTLAVNILIGDKLRVELTFIASSADLAFMRYNSAFGQFMLMFRRRNIDSSLRFQFLFLPGGCQRFVLYGLGAATFFAID